MIILVSAMVAASIMQYQKEYNIALIIFAFYDTIVAVIMTSFIFTAHFFIENKFKYITSLESSAYKRVGWLWAVVGVNVTG